MLSNVVASSSATGSVTASVPKLRMLMVSMNTGPSSSTRNTRRRLSAWSGIGRPLAVARWRLVRPICAAIPSWSDDISSSGAVPCSRSA